MTNRLTIGQAIEVVTTLGFGAMPSGWPLDMDLVARAYQSYANKSSHETATYFVTFYAHRYIVQSCQLIEC